MHLRQGRERGKGAMQGKDGVPILGGGGQAAPARTGAVAFSTEKREQWGVSLAWPGLATGEVGKGRVPAFPPTMC